MISVAGMSGLGDAGASCAPCLPSGDSARRIVNGDWSALPTATMHWLGRSALIGVGLAIAGLRGKQLVKGALLGATAIEAFVLTWAATRKGATGT